MIFMVPSFATGCMPISPDLRIRRFGGHVGAARRADERVLEALQQAEPAKRMAA